jgi:hypothetical protein
LPSGLGWALGLVGYLAGEGGVGVGETLDRMPLCQAFAVAAALHSHNGGKFSAPDYWTEEVLESL